MGVLFLSYPMAGGYQLDFLLLQEIVREQDAGTVSVMACIQAVPRRKAHLALGHPASLEID